MDAAAEDAVASTNIYMLDLVKLESNGGGHGMVVQVPDTEMYGSYPSLPAGTFRIFRVDGALHTAKAGDITVADRNYFRHGQVVVSASELGGRIGVVAGVTTVLDLVRLDGGAGKQTAVMSGVSPDGLRRVRELSLGDFVVSGPWLGRVVEVSLNLDVSFDDGAICKVTGVADFKKLRPAATYKRYRHQMNTFFYPGRRVTGRGASPAAVFKDCRWLSGYWKPSREVGTVVKVEMAGVLVCWVASAHYGTDQQLVEASAPPAYQDPNNLTFFCSDSDCYWGLADRCFLRNTEKQDESSTSSMTTGDDREAPVADPTARTKEEQEGRLNQKKLGQNLFFHGRHRRTRRRGKEFEQPMSVANTRTTVDVMWQDGTRQSGVPSTSLVPYDITDRHEFLPGQHVVDMAAHAAAVDDDAIGATTRRAGIVKSLNFKDRTVRVSWFKAAASSPDEAREVECDDTVSAYDLALALEADYHGFHDVVVRRPPSGRADDGSTVVQPRAQGSKNGAAVGADLSWVGRIIDRLDGHVQVKWGDDSTSTVLPHEISVVIQQHYKELEAEMGDWVEDDGVDERQVDDSAAASVNTSNDTQNSADDSNVEGDSDSADEDGNDSEDEDGIATTSATRLDDIVQSVIRLAGQVLAQGMRYMPNWMSPSSSSSSSSSELPAAMENVGAPAPLSDGHDDTNNADPTDDDDSAEKGKKAADATGDEEDRFRFPHFDVAQSPSDHHYLDNADQGGNGAKRWVKAVQKEWKILENGLPDTIYVRAFEDRMDLLRAVMVGASGTPYHDGLFFFDLHLPPSYPAAPPQVYYHSFGLRLNPNLYDSGTVCLSLLNTFGGEGTEVWSPATSSLLQVVVSIQGLILNDQPYYNEVGYEALVDRPEGRRNALPYSENAYLLTLRTALHLLRRPPRGFEGFVGDHFRRRGRFVLGACESYLRGCVVGTLDGDARATEGSKERPCPPGLRLALANVVPRLVAAFTEIGAEGCECDQFHELRSLLVGGDGPPATH